MRFIAVSSHLPKLLPGKRHRLSSGVKNASAKMSIVRELSLDAEIFLAYVHSQPDLKRETEQYPKQKNALFQGAAKLTF